MWYNSIRKVGVSMRLIQKFETQTTRGMLSKAWVELDDGTQCLIKGNSMENKIAGQEPFSEVIISRIGKALGLPVLRYELIERSRCEDFITLHGGIKYASICPSYAQGTSIQSISFYKYLVASGQMRTDLLVSYQRSGLSLEYLAKMLALDAFVGNPDRHLNNFEMYKSNGVWYNTIMFDFGAGLLAWKDSKYCRSITKGNKLYFDVAKPFKTTHYEQVKLMKRLCRTNTILGVKDKNAFYKHIFNSCEDVFDKMPDYRVKAIKNYLINRHIYLD